MDGLVHPRDHDERALTRKLPVQPCSILISSSYIKTRVAELAREIIHANRKINNDEINLLVVLKGAVFFGCLLAHEMFRLGGRNTVLHFVAASSYGKSKRSSGHCRLSGKLDMLRGKEVIVVEDIYDTGLTLQKIKKRLLNKELASSVKTCVLLDKASRRRATMKNTFNDFTGFKIPDVFVAGFGLDHAEKYRELPFIIAIGTKPGRQAT
jgi:hypoxanthine phosphoribosyltransferase